MKTVNAKARSGKSFDLSEREGLSRDGWPVGSAINGVSDGIVCKSLTGRQAPIKTVPMHSPLAWEYP